VDVNKKEATVGGIEKAVTIYGQPENCTNACMEVTYFIKIWLAHYQTLNQISHLF